MSDNLKNKTINSVIWSAYDRFGSQFIAFVIQVILARQLAPEVFGLIAMLNIFLAIGRSFVDSGFGSALIQRKNTTEEHYSSVFYFNIIIGILMALMLYFSAPLIALFFEQEILISLSRVLALKFLILPFGLIQSNLLMKDLNFKARTKVNISATTLSGIIGITMAFSGFGVWSLVAKMIFKDIFNAILLWVFNSWRPSLTFSYKAIKELFVFGSRMFLSGLLNVVFTNLYQIVIGRLFSPASLGYYTKARTLEQLPTKNITSIVSTVAFSSFSKVQDDVKRLRRGVKTAVNYLMYINFPLMLGLALVARPLVIVLLTEKWLPIVTYLQILCFAGVLYPLHVMNLNVLKSIGRSDLFFRIGLVKRTFTILGIVIGAKWGIIGIVYGQVIVSFINYLLNTYFTSKFIDYSALDQIKDITPYFIQTVFMGVIVYSINFIGFNSNFILLITQVLTGIVVYFIASLVFKLPVFFEILDLLFEHVHFLEMFKEKYFSWRKDDE